MPKPHAVLFIPNDPKLWNGRLMTAYEIKHVGPERLIDTWDPGTDPWLGCVVCGKTWPCADKGKNLGWHTSTWKIGWGTNDLIRKALPLRWEADDQRLAMLWLAWQLESMGWGPLEDEDEGNEFEGWRAYDLTPEALAWYSQEAGLGTMLLFNSKMKRIKR